MKIQVNLSLILLTFLCACSAVPPSSPTLANASEEIKQIKQGQMLPVTAITEIAGETINLEVAQTPEQQATGLMFRESLADDQGMLFPFASERMARFWMKNVPISLDMIFINGDRIVGIASDVPPCQAEPCPVYGPDALVDKVIELRGGRAKEIGIELGATITIQKFDSQR